MFKVEEKDCIDGDNNSEEIRFEETSNEIELKRVRKVESPSVEDASDNDIEAKQPRMSVTDMIGETIEEKNSKTLSDGNCKNTPTPEESIDEKDSKGINDGDCDDPLYSASNENKSRRTSMRKCKVQALQKWEESIKKKAEDRLMRTEIIDGLSFSSEDDDDDDGEQMDDSDQDPVWTPTDKDHKIDQRKGKTWTHRRKSITTQEKTPPCKSSVPDNTSWEVLNIVVESSNSQHVCDEEMPKYRFSNTIQTKLPSETKSQCQEERSPTTLVPVIKETIAEDRTIATKADTFHRKSRSTTSYKYTQSSHVIEGHFKAGNFVMEVADKDKPSPPIWRIEGKSLLQRFEPFNDHGRLLYRNASSYSAWNSTTVYKYTGVNVLLVSHNRNSSVVENLGPISKEEEILKFSLVGEGPQVWLYNCRNEDPVEENKPEESSTNPHQEAFEVFLQTLLSQVLDPSFIIEIIKENDDYFLSHLNSIAETTEEKKKKIFKKNELSEQLRNMVETLPSINVLPNSDASDQMCDVCNKTKGQHVIHCVGHPYDPTSLIRQPLSDHKFPLNNKAPVCATCAHAVVLYSHMHHHKYNFYLKCRKKVDDVRSFKQNKEESHMLLEECLQDTIWVNQMFQEIKDMWSASDNLR